MSERRHPSAGSIVIVVLIWVIGLPALLFFASIVALGVGFSADSGGDGDPAAAAGVVMLVGVVVLAGLSVLVAGGIDDEPPAPPPRPYAGRPLHEVPSVTGSWPAKRRTGDAPGDTPDPGARRVP